MSKDVRMRGFQDRATVKEVYRLLQDRILPLSPESISLNEAEGRALAAPVLSEVDVPGFPRAAMDGYAVRGEETFGAGSYNPLELTVIGEVLPGQSPSHAVESGQAMRIMTGAPLPQGADAVLMAEATEEFQQGEVTKVRMTEAVTPGRHVGQPGEDIKKGTTVLPQGRVLRPQDLGVMASIGAAQPTVYRQPQVTVLITGDELLSCGSRPEGYRIVDSNSIMLTALIRRDGGLPCVPSIVPDGYDSVREALNQALQSGADMILLSGGSSVGKEDHAPRIVAEMGELAIHGVALRPAGPAGIGWIDSRPVFLMPGNPVSCLCAYDLFTGPALRRMGGRIPEIQSPGPLRKSAASREPGPYGIIRLPLARKIASVVGRVDYVRAQIHEEEVEPLATSGASILSSTTRADGFVLVPAASEGYAPGEMVTVFLYG